MRTHPARVRVLAAVTALGLVVAACGRADEPAAAPDEPDEDVAAPDDGDDTDVDPVDDVEDCDEVTARLSHHLGEANTGHQSFVAMNEELQQTTDGRVTIEIFPAAQLGGLNEMVESLQGGVIELAWLATGPLSQFAPEIGGLELPFIYEDEEQFHDLIDGPIGDQVNQLIRDEIGVEILFWSQVGFLMPFFQGETDVTDPADFQGLTMRVAATPVFLSTMRALGSEAVDMPLGDVYTAMQTGAVTGSILPYWAFRDTSLYEVSDSMTEVGVILANLALGADPAWLDSLCDHDRQAVVAAAQTAQDMNRAGWPAEDAEDREYLIGQGIQMVQVDDITPFQEATQSVIQEWEADNGGEIWEQVKAELGL